MQYKPPLKPKEAKWVLDTGNGADVDYSKYAHEVC